MKKNLTTIILSALLLSCSESNTSDPSTESTVGQTITIAVGTQDPETKVATDYSDSSNWSFGWEYGDKLTAVDNTYAKSTMSMTSYGADSSTFSGDVSDSATSYGLLYGYSEDSSSISIGSDGSVVLDLTAQNGEMDDIYMATDGTVDTESESTQICHLCSFLELDITYTNTLDITLESIEISGFNSKGSVSFLSGLDDDNYSTTNTDSIVITLENSDLMALTSNTLYVNILPTELTTEDTFTFKLYFSDGTRVDVEKSPIESGAISRGYHETLLIACDLSNRVYEFDNADFDSTYTYTDFEYYEIATTRQMKTFATLVNESKILEGNVSAQGKFKLTANIDLSGIEWTPIGSKVSDGIGFSGIFDGGGYTISNLTINNSDLSCVGLFYAIDSYDHNNHTILGQIRNLTLSNIDITSTVSDSYVGAIIGCANSSSGLVYNCGVESGSITLSANSGDIGGLIGVLNSGCAIYNCYNQASVIAEGYSSTSDIRIGGICGWNNRGTLNNTYNSGIITAATSSSLLYRGAVAGYYSSPTTSLASSPGNNYYLTGCAGSGIYGSGMANGVSIDTTGIISKSDSELKDLASTLSTNAASLTVYNFYKWKSVADSYPVLDYETIAE